jgi:hypothetical protein
VRTGDALVFAPEHIQACGLELERLADLVSYRRHFAAALWADTPLGRDGVEHLHARQVLRQRRASWVMALAASLRLALRLLIGLRADGLLGGDALRKGQRELVYDALKRLGAGPLA